MTGAESVRSFGTNRSASEGGKIAEDDQAAIIENLREQIRSSRKIWQHQIWELEGQLREMKAEIEQMRGGDVCDVCGRGKDTQPTTKDSSGNGVLNRPKPKTGSGARFGNGNNEG